MSLLIHELSQIIDRVLVLAATKSDLRKLFENLAFELTMQLGPNQNMDLQVAAVADGPVHSWVSFTLGLRGKLKVRLTMIGASTESGASLSELLEIADALFIFAPPSSAAIEEFLRLKISPAVAARPCVIVGLAQAEPDLATLAVAEWAKRNFRKCLFLKTEADFLREGLEWVLSF